MQFVQFQLCDFATGAAIPFGQCGVYLAGTSTPAALFDVGGGSISNPAIASAAAQVGFAAADGIYDYQPFYANGTVNGPKILHQQFRDLFLLGSPQAVALASETIGAGAFGNLYDNAGVLTVRNANANDPTKFANAFAPAGIANGGSGNMTLFGVNSFVTLPANTTEVWLSDVTPGGFVTTAPTASGSIIQPLGMAVHGFGIIFTPQARIQL